jgi:transcriptional regulator with XRE-family HTH domain
MSRTFIAPFPSSLRQMRALGERLKIARLRRQITTLLMAERVGVSRDTLHRLENGDPNIAFGTYVRALRVLGLDKDLDVPSAWTTHQRRPDYTAIRLCVRIPTQRNR